MWRLDTRLAFTLTLLLYACRLCGAAPELPPRTAGVVLILIPTLRLADVKSMPALRSVMNRGSAALMSIRIGKPLSAPFAAQGFDPLASGYLTLATGSRASASEECSRIFEPDEMIDGKKAAMWWAEFRQKTAPKRGLLAPWLENCLRKAAAAPYEVSVGSLGRLFQKKGIRTDVIGNADTPEQPHREASLFLIDREGVAPEGFVSRECTTPDASYPFGLRTNTSKLLKRLASSLKTCRFIVIETGDPARYARYEQKIMPTRRPIMRARVLASADAVVGAALQQIPKDWVLAIASPGQLEDPELPGADGLTPFIVYRDTWTPGLLSSGSTKAPGVVTNTDLAATLAAWLGINIDIGTGRAIVRVESSNPSAAIHSIAQGARFQEEAHDSVYAVVYFALGFVVISCILLSSASNSVHRIGRVLALIPSASLTALLVFSALQPDAITLVIETFAAAIFLAALALLTRLSGIAEILAAVSAFSVLGAWRTGLLARAAASYEIQGGARYYGIGNEYGGLLVGALMFLMAAFAITPRKWQRRLVLAGAAAVSVITGHPAIGANAGVMLGGLTGCVVLVSRSGEKLLRKCLAPSIAAAVCLLLMFAMMDSLRPVEQQSHFGHAINEIRSEGLQSAAHIISRKVSLNIMLLQNSPWALLLMGTLAGSIILTSRRGFEGNPLRSHCLWATTIALFLFNDSGVLASAACGLWLYLDASWRTISTKSKDISKTFSINI